MRISFIQKRSRVTGMREVHGDEAEMHIICKEEIDGQHPTIPMENLRDFLSQRGMNENCYSCVFALP